MAKAWITEFSRMARDFESRPLQLPEEPPAAEQVVDFTAGVTASTAASAGCRFARVQADTDCHFRVTAAGYATQNASSSYRPLAAGPGEIIGLLPGQTVSFIAA